MSSSNERASRNPLYANVQIKEKMDAFRDAAGRVGPALRVVKRARTSLERSKTGTTTDTTAGGVSDRGQVCALSL